MTNEYVDVEESPVGHADVTTVAHHLDARGVSYEIVKHEPTMTARADARVTGAEPSETAKSVVLTDGEVYFLAVIPASEALDLRKVRRLIGDDKSLRMATEADMAETFPAFEVGAVPPIGSLVFAGEVIDERLLAHDHVLCGGGDHRHSLRLDPEELARITEAGVGDLCAD